MLTAPMPIDPDPQRTWRAALGGLELEVSVHSFATWLRGTRALRFDGDTLVVEARTSFGCDWLNTRLLPVVERALHRVTGHEVPVRFISPGLADEACATPAPPPPAPTPCIVGALNAAYTFDRYIPSAGNREAIETARSFVDGPGPYMSPLVAWGAPGMGKTHLLHALGALALQAGWPVACLPAEQFTRRFLHSIESKQGEAFQADLRSNRLLILDDLQDLEGKKKTAEEFAYTLDAVATAGGVVAVASEKHPRDLAIPERLISRLQQGFVSEIQPLAREERRAFVERHSAFHRVGLPSWAIDRIAAAEYASVRDLQGVVNSAVSATRAGRLDHARVDSDIVRVCVQAVATAAISVSALLDSVAAHFDARAADLIGRDRKGNLETARAAAVAILRSHGHSVAAIARTLDGRDPSTVSGLVKRGQTIVETEPALRRLLAS